MMVNNLESRTRLIGVVVLLLLGAWVLHSFLALLIWAVVLAVTTWPIYQRLLKAHQFHGNTTWVALALTLLIGAMILVPLGYGLGRLVDEAQSLGQLAVDIKNTGLPVPPWLKTLPVVGEWASNFWYKTLASPEAADKTLHWLTTGGAVAYTKSLASQLVQRLLGFLLTLVVLFFVYQHGENLGRQIFAISRKWFGKTGSHYVTHATTAVRATVNGLVLVGLGEGLLLGIGYAFTGFSHPAILGALTGVFAMIPFAAKFIVLSCVLVLMAEGNMALCLGLAIFGTVVILLADNYVRPLLIGGSVQLPFIWTLLGIFGGLENFGLLGLFLGPTLMAVLMSIWRDWMQDMHESN